MNGNDETVSLRQYVDTNFELRDRALKIQHDASEQALTLATVQLESRLEKLNELRGNVISKGEFDAVEKRVAALEKWQAKIVGIGVVLGLFAGFIGAVIMRLFSKG
jgi:hypothetical protein